MKTSRQSYQERRAGRLMRKAAEVLTDRNWIKNVYSNDNNGYCMLGALNLALCGNSQPKHYQPLVTETKNLFHSWSGSHIPIFNDRIAKSKEEVIETMLKFANEFDPQR